ncbi:MAG: FAD binding domain-containing protein [Planctomycetes bacterium]|nr:FAD binding domain-containing protein [Planctomycetota bacterium]
MRVPDLQLHRPTSLDEVFAATQRHGEYDLLGGGTDLLCNYKWRLNVRPQVISLRHLPELREELGGALAAGRTLYEVEHCSILQELCPEVPRAASKIATPLIRRSATLGGNLHLDTRCWHFNQTAEWRMAHDSCLKAEADQCRVQPVPGDVCVATYSGDLAPVLMGYGAIAVVAGPEGERSVALKDYFALDGIRRFADRRSGELMVRLDLPQDASEWTVRYEKLRLRATFDFPEGGVAVAVRWTDGPGSEVAAARIATTAYDSIPRLHEDLAARLVGRCIEEELAEELGASLRDQVRPMKNTSMSPAYRKKMARVLCKRAILACLPSS